MSAGLPSGLGPTYWSTWTARGQSVSESLEDGEAWMGGWDAVGLYEGNNKVAAYQSMTVHITTHRILLVPDTPSTPSLQVALKWVRQTELYAGFMRSSPKITLTLGKPEGGAEAVSLPSASSVPSTPSAQESSWTCGVCGNANPLPPGTNVTPSSKCQLCGVAYATSRTMSPPPSRAPTPARTATPAPAAVPPPGPASPAPPAPSTGEQIACPACTFLNHPSMANCEICGTALPRPKRRSHLREKESDIARLSFRKGGVNEAYRRLKGVLSDKVWERVAEGRPTSARPGESKLGGIDAIMRNMTLDAQTHDAHMQDAFKDLEVLMVRAGEMVRLAQSLNSKLSAAGSANEEEATLVRSSLVRLGLPAPALTQDMVRDERAYLDGLARELGSVLTGRGEGLMMQPGQGVIALDSVWGLWMRARGVALLPPSTLANLLPMLPSHTSPPIRSLDLPSGLTVLYTPLYAPSVLLGRLVERMTPRNAKGKGREGDFEQGLSIIDIAAVEGLPIGLATELVDMVAAQPGVGIVRDDQASPADGGTKWYRDIISTWPLGQVV